jgi:hypothetical protein
MKFPLKNAALAAVSVLFVSTAAYSPAALAVSVVADPAVANEFGAKIRWGGTGYEAGIRDNGADTPTLNATGAPVWSSHIGNPHNFEVFWDSSTGTVSLKVDFNRDSSFADTVAAGTDETISRNVFLAGGSGQGLTDYTGKAFNFVTISGNGFSSLTNLVINGSSLPSITPGGVFTQFYYGGTNNPTGDILITGQVTFLNATGNFGESPAWNFSFKEPVPVTPVPEPSAVALMLAGLGVVGFAARRRRVR